MLEIAPEDLDDHEIKIVLAYYTEGLSLHDSIAKLRGIRPGDLRRVGGWAPRRVAEYESLVRPYSIKDEKADLQFIEDLESGKFKPPPPTPPSPKPSAPVPEPPPKSGWWGRRK